MSRELSFVPGQGLITSNDIPDAPASAPKDRWVLFNNEWIDIQNIVQQTLKLPISTNDFVAAYGSFSHEKEIHELIRGLQKVSGLASDFGNPSLLKAKIVANSSYLSSETPPKEIYSHVVWLANRIFIHSRKFSHDLSNLDKYLNPKRYSKAQRAQNLKSVLIGKNGLVTVADDIVKLTNALLTKLDSFSGNIQDAEGQIIRYAGNSSEILQAAKATVKDLNDKIEQELRPKEQSAQSWSKWLLYAAVGVALVTLVVVSAGLLAPLATGATAAVLATVGSIGTAKAVGAAAAGAGALYLASRIQNSSYNELVSDIARQREEVRKKSALVLDLGTLNNNVLQLPAKLKSFRSNLEKIKEVWSNVGSDLTYIANTYSVEMLGDLPTLNQKLNIEHATTQWQAVGDSVQSFIQNSLVTYDFIQWGEKLRDAA